MALENLKQNIEKEKEIVAKLIEISDGTPETAEACELMTNMLRMLNNSVPSLIGGISPIKKLGKVNEVNDLVSIKAEGKMITINRADRKKFLDYLSVSDYSLKRAKKSRKLEGADISEFKKPSNYAKISNLFFFNLSNRLVERGNFKTLDRDLRKANLTFLLNTYISMVLFSTLLALVFSAVLFVVLIFFRVSIDFPFLFMESLTSKRLLTNVAICLGIPIAVFLLAFFYPAIEKQGIEKKVNQELPFVVIHMAAIARSGIEPSQIFRVMALSKEYPYTRREMKKVVNQVNVYGYDLVNSLKNSARTTSSNKIAELFNGLATTIAEGGSLADFFDKRAETLLFDYKLEKEKSTKMAETFMDIYISMVIAAPMIMMVLLVLMNVSSMSMGLGLDALTVIIISIVALINIIFLAFLHIKQTGY